MEDKMLRILLKRKYLYEVEIADNTWEQHYRYTYLDVGYKGKGNIGQKYFITITKEDYCQQFLGALMIWNSPF